MEKATAKPKIDGYYQILQYFGLALIVVGFAGPWYYGPLGKSSDFGWQPVWGFISGLIYINAFILLSVVHCEAYAELTYKQGRPVLEGILKWIGFFLLLVVVVPLAVWLLFDQTGRNRQPQQPLDSFGWGVWVALAGLIIQVIALRLRIHNLF